MSVERAFTPEEVAEHKAFSRKRLRDGLIIAVLLATAYMLGKAAMS